MARAKGPKPPTSPQTVAQAKAAGVVPGNIASLKEAMQRKQARTRSEILDRIVEALRIGASPEAACAYAGICRSTYYDWRKKDPVFAEETDQAQAAAEVQLLMEIRAETSWQAKAWILERRWRERWGREARQDSSQDAPKIVLTWGDEGSVQPPIAAKTGTTDEG